MTLRIAASGQPRRTGPSPGHLREGLG